MNVTTTDERMIKVSACIESLQKLKEVHDKEIYKIGLLKSKPLCKGSDFTQEEYFLDVISEAGLISADNTVTILLPDLDISHDRKSDLGCRGIRHCLSYPEEYRFFLRAILRAGMHFNYELALPMVGCVAEIERFKQILNDIRVELDREGLTHRPPLIGTVVEVPSVIPLARTIAFDSRFFIIGENFLKFLMADDSIIEGRKNGFFFYNQAFLLQVITLIQNLNRRKADVRIWVPIVEDIAAIPLLVGLGFDEIIAPLEVVPDIITAVESTSYMQAKMVASKATSYTNAEQAREYVLQAMSKLL
ncbi:MAG: putative PEP-binding protein [Eubacteriales bacterium]